MNIHLTVGMKQGMMLVMTMGMRSGIEMIKYKLYTHSGVMYVVPLDKYEYIDGIAESYFEDYCVGLLTQWILFTSHELDRFVDECIIDNGRKVFDIWSDDYYVVMNKGGDSFDDVLEIPLIGERKTTSGLENCSIWWG